MKRAVSLLLSASILLGLLAACQGPGEEPDYGGQHISAKELVDAAYLSSGHGGNADVEFLTKEDEEDYLSAYLENAYAVEEPWEDAAVIRATGASAFELAVLRMADEDAAVRTASSLMRYISYRQGDFVGYAPAAADMVANGVIRQNGPYAALFICPDPERVEAAFLAALGRADQIAPKDTGGPAESGEPALKATDLAGRLLLEAACPEWVSIVKTWRTSEDWEETKAKYGIGPEQYVDFAGSAWGPTYFEETAETTWVEYGRYEVAVFQAESEDGAKKLAKALKNYVARRLETACAVGLAEDAAVLENGLIVQEGRYAALIVSDHAREAARLFPQAVRSNETQGFFTRCIEEKQSSVSENYDPVWTDRIRFVQPNKDDMSLYDTSAILAAWEKGESSGLSKYDRDIYDQAEKVLKKLLKDGMTDFEKELVIYDWVVNNVNYDWTHQDIMATTIRESFTPYGGLVNRQAVCLGYAATFQLLMDLAGVECITVAGAAFESREDHAWNMVRLNGEWYCVDVTWDANAREQIGLTGLENWNYFNVTSSNMAKSNHQWDYANTPEATAEDQGWG